MTDNQIAEIYAIAREAFGGGQRAIQMQSYPFRMTAENLAKHRLDPNMAFWKQLKVGSDHFEVSKREPAVGACGKRYVFDAQAANGGQLDAASPCPVLTEDPEIKSLVAEKESADSAKVAELIAKGMKPVKIMYADGGQHPDFAHVDEVSRPEALEKGPVEIAPGCFRPSPMAWQGKGEPVPAVFKCITRTMAQVRRPQLCSAIITHCDTWMALLYTREVLPISPTAVQCTVCTFTP